MIESTYPSMDHNLLCQPSPFSWDMQLLSMPHLPCFHFISRKLAQCKLYVVFILSASGSSCVPAWPVSRAAHFKLIRIFRRACELFPTVPQWVAQIASCSSDLRKLERLEARPSDAYLTRRSLIQHELVFSGEGMTLLSVDHVYTFKQCLSALSDKKPFAAGYKPCIVSCVHLLRRLNSIYSGVRISRSYLTRAYGTPLDLFALEKVHEVYLREFRELGVQGMTVEPNDSIPRLPELESPTERQPTDPLPELRDTGTRMGELQAPCQTTETAWSEALVSPMWSARSGMTPDVTYPKVPTPTRLPAFPSPVPTPPGVSELTTTICSRCLVGIETQEVPCKQEMTTLMSPEWEDFRRIGLGILTY